MYKIAIESIVIGEDRQRRQFDPEAITSLANDIANLGLIHPIVLRDHGEPRLVAGERRLRAIQQLAEAGVGINHSGDQLEAGWIPYTVMGELSELEYKEAELSENVLRVDITWQERTAAIAELNRLREGQAATRGEQWSPAMTAREISGSPNSGGAYRSVRNSLILEDYLDDPDVVKAKTEKDAIKIVTRKKQEEARRQLAEDFDPTASPHTLLRGDCLEHIAELPDSSFDVILCDPPYGIEMHKDQSWDGSWHEYDDSSDTWEKLFSILPTEYFRVAKPEAHLYLFCDILRFPLLAEFISLAGWVVWPRPLIWYKGNTGAYPRPNHGPRYTYEAILFANKGDRQTTKLYHDVLCVDQPINQAHPAGKPPELYADLLRRSVLPGDTVLDTFCGSGPIFPAADLVQAVATGIELSDTYADMAAERLLARTDDADPEDVLAKIAF